MITLQQVDFRKIELPKDKKILSIEANDEYKLNAVKDILQSKLHKRGIDIQAIKFEDIQQMGGMLLRRNITLIQGIEKETDSSKKIISCSICGNALKISEYVINPRSLPFLIIVSTRSPLNSFFKSAFKTLSETGRFDFLADFFISFFGFFFVFIFFAIIIAF